MKYEEIILDSLINNGVDYIVHIPDKILLPIIKLAEKRKFPNLILVTREEEGIGICAGIYMSGHRPVILMQSSGIGNSITAITSLLQTHYIPLLIIISIRGGLFEYNPADTPLGRSMSKLLDALSIPYFVPGSPDELRYVINGSIPLCQSSQNPVVIGLNDQMLRRYENET
ncbi:MAG: sulfopyruvate decarboxylase subunit alpha [Candidatus Parvarchaeota archaeon]